MGDLAGIFCSTVTHGISATTSQLSLNPCHACPRPTLALMAGADPSKLNRWVVCTLSRQDLVARLPIQPVIQACTIHLLIVIPSVFGSQLEPADQEIGIHNSVAQSKP